MVFGGKLPAELVELIGLQLDRKSLISFSSTCRYSRNVVRRVVFKEIKFRVLNGTPIKVRVQQFLNDHGVGNMAHIRQHVR